MNVRLFAATLAPREREGGGAESYYAHLADDGDETLKVSRRLPPRPRLRIEGLAKGGAPVDLLPAFDARGRVQPHRWVLPQVRSMGRWETPIASTDAIVKRCRALGLRVRVLDVL